ARSHRSAHHAQPRHRRFAPQARDLPRCGVSGRGCRSARARTRGRLVTLWHGRFEGGPAEELLAYTVSLPFDRRLAVDDIAGSRAHVRGLRRAELLDDDEAAAILGALDTVEGELAAGAFTFEPSDEDIHTAV